MKITKADILVVTALLIVSIYFIIAPHNGVKKLYLISEDGRKELPLKADRIELDGGSVIIETSTEGGRFIESDCPNKICIRSGWVTECGDTSACVPNRYALVIECRKETGYDAVSE